jgi:4,5-DOPA dioxygenase extradiol
MNEIMPSLFIGHGNPMITLSKNVYTDGWAAIGRVIPRPRAVLMVSAHWYLPGCAVTANAAPGTIHDFGGFPQELYEIQYPAQGSPELARLVKKLLSPVTVELDGNRGLDHGAWSVLRHIFPLANIPVVQLSIDSMQPALFHFELGKRLASLREEGILIVGSGNLVHNLQRYSWGNSAIEAFDWASRFEIQMREFMVKKDYDRIVAYEELGSDASLSVPSPDHFLPLLYVLGLCHEKEPITFPVEGFDGGSMSMLAAQIG